MKVTTSRVEPTVKVVVDIEDGPIAEDIVGRAFRVDQVVMKYVDRAGVWILKDVKHSGPRVLKDGSGGKHRGEAYWYPHREPLLWLEVIVREFRPSGSVDSPVLNGLRVAV